MKLCGFDIGLDQPFFLIAGTCSIEGLEMSIDVAGKLKEITSSLGIPLIYKGSFDKANRSSGNTKRGVGLESGLNILAEVRKQTGLPVLTDVHEIGHIADCAAGGSTQRVHFGNSIVNLGCVACGDGQLDARARKDPRDAATDPFGATGDNDAAAFQ